MKVRRFKIGVSKIAVPNNSSLACKYHFRCICRKLLFCGSGKGVGGKEATALGRGEKQR